jgi:hypothetical protein
MEPRAIISRVTDVQRHPNSDKLNIITIAGKTNIADQPAPGVPRYQIGDYAVVLVDNLLLPEWLLKLMELWNDDRNRGFLAGSKGNRTKSRKIAEIVSDVALCKIGWNSTAAESIADGYVKRYIRIWIEGDDHAQLSIFTDHADSIDLTPEGIDVTEWLEILPYEAPNK